MPLLDVFLTKGRQADNALKVTPLPGTNNNKQEFYHQSVLTPVQHDVLFGNKTSLQMQMMIGNQIYSYHLQIFTKF